MSENQDVTSCRRDGFTIVELLVVLSIIVIVMGLLLPSVTSAWRAARLIQCSSNLRQLCISIYIYASTNDGKFPPNVAFPSPGKLWCDDKRVGALVSSLPTDDLGSRGGGAFRCPDDDKGVRSYSMNIWASSRTDSYIINTLPTRGKLFGSHVRNASQLILIAESWASTTAFGGFAALPTIGYEGETPGQRFGVGGGIAPPLNCGPWGIRNSELPFGRHVRTDKGKQYPLNFGYADGHVAAYVVDDLADRSTGLSRLTSLWSPSDPDLNYMP